MITQTREINFETLSLRDAMDLAMLIEEEAHDRYVELADQLAVHHTEAAATFFRRMARIEQKHRDQLAAQRQQTFGAGPMVVTRAMIFDIEAPGYDEVRAFMSERAALLTALGAEEKAQKFFDSALPHVRDPAVHELFTHLRDEEIEHQQLVKAELARRAPDDPTNPDDFGDDPVPQ